MSEERLVSIRNVWFVSSVGLTISIGLFAAFVGFVWLPSVQPDASFQGVWNAICSAAGVPRAWLAPTPPVKPTAITSAVVVTPQMASQGGADAIGRGATLALKCTMCHGARGLSEADSPNLGGQYAAVVFKELQDFKSGARTNAVMGPMAADLGEQDMMDLAAYYAYLPRLPAYRPAVVRLSAPSIVAQGAPMRNIAPCAACHGGMDVKVGAPWLEGESPVYLKAQLEAFASGVRHNDISDQMRNIARHMTPAEIDAAAQYYASQP